MILMRNWLMKPSILFLNAWFFVLIFIAGLHSPPVAHAEDQFIRVSPTIYKTSLVVSPRNQTIIDGSTFDVGIYLDTKGQSVNTVELNIKFSPDKLTLIKPSAGTSLISIWLEPPTYSNSLGSARLVGLITNGVTTERGLITTLTFKATGSGVASVKVDPTSRVLMNDGFGSEAELEYGTALYSIQPKAPDGPVVYSDTHPFQEEWYNNPSPVIYWDKETKVTDFSYELDNKPFTIPDNIAESEDAIIAYEDLPDGLWYFHVKSRKSGVWGGTTHFLARVDTTPPAVFTPRIDVVSATVIRKALVEFFTTDTLSGIDHYEVGIVNKDSNSSPGFVQADSPYQITNVISGEVRVIVRAFDRAGNIRDASVDVYVKPYRDLAKRFAPTILLALLALILLFVLLHFLFGHHFVAKEKKTYEDLHDESKKKVPTLMPIPNEDRVISTAPTSKKPDEEKASSPPEIA